MDWTKHAETWLDQQDECRRVIREADARVLAEFASEVERLTRQEGSERRVCERCLQFIGPLCQHIIWYDENGKEYRRHAIDCTAPVANGVAVASSQGGEL